MGTGDRTRAPVRGGRLPRVGYLRRRIARGRRRLRAAEAVVAEVGTLPGLVHEGRTLVIETSAREARRPQSEPLERGIRVASLADGWSGDSAVRHGIVLAHSNVEASVLRRVLGEIRELGDGGA